MKSEFAESYEKKTRKRGLIKKPKNLTERSISASGGMTYRISPHLHKESLRLVWAVEARPAGETNWVIVACETHAPLFYEFKDAEKILKSLTILIYETIPIPRKANVEQHRLGDGADAGTRAIYQYEHFNDRDICALFFAVEFRNRNPGRRSRTVPSSAGGAAGDI